MKKERICTSCGRFLYGEKAYNDHIKTHTEEDKKYNWISEAALISWGY